MVVLSVQELSLCWEGCATPAVCVALMAAKLLLLKSFFSSKVISAGKIHFSELFRAQEQHKWEALQHRPVALCAQSNEIVPRTCHKNVDQWLRLDRLHHSAHFTA